MPAELTRDKMGPRKNSRGNMVSVLDSIRSISRALRVSSRESEQSFGLTSAQVFVLAALLDRPPMSVNEIARRTYTHQSSASMVAARLAEKGFVTRSVSRSDARRLAVSISPSGRAILRKAPSGAQTALVSALRAMPRGELRRLASCLENLTSRIADQSEGDSQSRTRGAFGRS